MGLLPSSPDVSTDGSPRVVGVDSDEAGELVSALSSETARRILATLHEDPAPPSAVADRVDTSLQNAQYHLGRLEDAGAVEVAGTAYSEKGREMDVFAPADAPLVIVAGDENSPSLLRDVLGRFVGGVGALAVGALAIQQAFGEGVLPVARSGGGEAGAADGGEFDAGAAGTTETATETALDATASPTPTPGSDGPGIMVASTETPAPTGTETEVATAASTPTPTPAPTPEPMTEVATTAASDPGGLLALGALPPGVWFFLGGLSVLLVGLAITYR